jgi:hypothetical protein
LVLVMGIWKNNGGVDTSYFSKNECFLRWRRENYHQYLGNFSNTCLSNNCINFEIFHFN